MQPAEKANNSSKKNQNRLKSATWLPKTVDAYFVAFALKETYDDLVTAQQMICSKRSPQESINSITPSNSLKIIDSELAGKLDQIVDAPENSIVEEKYTKELMPNPDNAENKEAEDKKGTEEKEDITMNKNVCTETKNAIEREKTNETEYPLKTRDVFEKQIPNTKEKLAEEKSFTEKESVNANYDPSECQYVIKCESNDNEPEIIFNATNYTKKENKFPKKKAKNDKNVKSSSIKFKRKITKRNIRYHLEKHNVKSKKNVYYAAKLQKGLYSNISTVVSRTRVLRKVLAKENLLEETELISLCNDANFNDDGSFSSFFTDGKSFTSNTSDKTITQQASLSSRNDEDSVKTVKSVIEISSENMTPYKTEVINVAVAVAYKASKVTDKEESLKVNSREKNIYLVDLTSTETVTIPTTNLTSDTPSDNENMNNGNINMASDDTLVNTRTVLEVSSDEDTFDMARTSSEFNKSSIDSTFTLKNDLETVIDVVTSEVEEEKVEITKRKLLETVINLGYNPEVTPSTSYAGSFDIDQDDVLVTGALNKNYVKQKNRGDDAQVNIPSNILKKIFNHSYDSATKKKLNIPNQAHIKALLKENELPLRKCAVESRNYAISMPFSMTDLWEQIILLLDRAMKRIEKTLPETIVKELNKVLAGFELKTQTISKGDVMEKDDIESNDVDTIISTKLISAQDSCKETNQGLQCDLVQNKVIDHFMLQISTERAIVIEPGRPANILENYKKTKNLKDYIEVLKPPAVVSPQPMADRGDMTPISTIHSTYEKLNRFKILSMAPLNFVTENVLILTSIPAFIFALLFIYGIMFILIKFW